MKTGRRLRFELANALGGTEVPQVVERPPTPCQANRSSSARCRTVLLGGAGVIYG